MDSIWSSIIKVSGAVGVVALLIYTVLNYIFSDKLIELFGSEKLFTLAFIIITGLLIVLLVAVVTSKKNSQSSNKSGDIKVSYNDKSRHHGDNNF
jgi:hypothetical protein